MTCISCPSNAAGKDGRCLPCRGRHAATFRRKHVWTEAMDQELRRAFAVPGQMREASKAITDLCVRHRFPRYIVNNRAKRLGLSLRTQDFWTPAELEYVREHAGELSLNEMSKQLGRSTSAISHQIYKLGLSRAVTEGYSLKELKELFGTSFATVDKWIGRGWLVVNDVHRVPYASVEKFIWDHMEEIRFASCEEWWLKTMLKSTIGRRDIRRAA